MDAKLRAEVRRALPYAVVLAVALGSVVAIGSQLSTAFPSESRPFGWPGRADLDNAVASVRNDLLLATTIPALLLGISTTWRRAPDPAWGLARAIGVDVALLLGGALLGGVLAWLGADEATLAQFGAFVLAHALLALAFYALAVLAGALGGGAPLAATVWIGFLAVYENAVRWLVFRDAGYHRLAAGDFPLWFLVAQALSPISAYRGVLILSERGFMDYLEQATIGQAALPAWVNPVTFTAFLLVVWTALPLALALLVWRRRGRQKAFMGAPGFGV